VTWRGRGPPWQLTLEPWTAPLPEGSLSQTHSGIGRCRVSPSHRAPRGCLLSGCARRQPAPLLMTPPELESRTVHQYTPSMVVVQGKRPSVSQPRVRRWGRKFHSSPGHQVFCADCQLLLYCFFLNRKKLILCLCASPHFFSRKPLFDLWYWVDRHECILSTTQDTPQQHELLLIAK